MAGGPALAMPAGFGEAGLPIGIQIVGPDRAELACLQLAQAYDVATGWVKRRLPPLLGPGQLPHSVIERHRAR
jgi:amidase